MKKNGVDVKGIDISEGMIHQAQIIHNDIEFLVGDMFNLNIADNQGDFYFYEPDLIIQILETAKLM